MNIGIYIYDQAEVLDFSGPYEVFSTASRICAGGQPFEAYIIAENSAPVAARAGYLVTPACSIQEHPELDVLVVSGGVHDQEMHKPQVLNWVREQSSNVQIMASVCTGAFILAQAGLLEGHKVTTHWQDIAELADQFPQLSVVENVRWVDQGRLITSAGISAGIDMSLHLVSKLHSNELAKQTAKQMDFDWTKNPEF